MPRIYTLTDREWEAVRDLLAFAEDQAGDVFDGEEWEENLEAINKACEIVGEFIGEAD